MVLIPEQFVRILIPKLREARGMDKVRANGFKRNIGLLLGTKN